MSSQNAVCDKLMTKLDYEEDRATMSFLRRRRLVDETKSRVLELKREFNKNHENMEGIKQQLLFSQLKGEPSSCRTFLRQEIETHERKKDKLVCQIVELERMLNERANADFARPEQQRSQTQ
ncbi:unnamed protein product [Oikopleura dioica]|uniref:Uncharacterized protein n=1 Tax=Oikopleura dioica TaxID=34765 RepID=E4XS72_OIKDI|nr:unnamed protein product [Oikopleura dioica]